MCKKNSTQAKIFFEMKEKLAETSNIWPLNITVPPDTYHFHQLVYIERARVFVILFLPLKMVDIWSDIVKFILAKCDLLSFVFQ